MIFVVKIEYADDVTGEPRSIKYDEDSKQYITLRYSHLNKDYLNDKQSTSFGDVYSLSDFEEAKICEKRNFKINKQQEELLLENKDPA